VGLSPDGSRLLQLLRPPNDDLDGGRNVGATLQAVTPGVRALLSPNQVALLSELSAELWAKGRWRHPPAPDKSSRQGLPPGAWTALMADEEAPDVRGPLRVMLICQGLMAVFAIRSALERSSIEMELFKC